MKIISIVILSFMVMLSNSVLAGVNVKKPEDKEFEQAKIKILKDVSVRIEVMTNFRSCVKSSKKRHDLSTCKKKKNRADKALKIKAEKAREKKNSLSQDEIDRMKSQLGIKPSR